MDFFNSLRRFLIAPRTVIWLLAAILAAVLISTLIPQLTYRGPAYFQQMQESHPLLFQLITGLRLHRIYSSFWFLGLVVLLGVSLSLTTWQQFSRLRTRPAPFKLSPELPSTCSLPVSDRARQAIADGRLDSLLGRRFRLLHIDSLTRFYGRGEAGRWGSPLFHLGLLLILLAGIYGLLHYQRGFVQLMLGETLVGAQGNWLEQDSGLLGGDLRVAADLTLTDFRVEYGQNKKKPVYLGSRLLVKTPDDSTTREVELSVSAPLRISGVTFYQSSDFGYALTFLEDPRSLRPTSTAFLLDANGAGGAMSGQSAFGDSDYLFHLNYRPAAGAMTNSVQLQVRQKGRERYSGTLGLGQSFILDGHEFRFVDIRFWSGLHAARGYALWLVYPGFFLLSLGAGLLYLVAPQEVVLKLEPAAEGYLLLIGWRSKWMISDKGQVENLCRKFRVELEAYQES